ncbi:YugN family protein [Paenibacillus sp. J2TS4]|uniref:YugN family protein n=1 Tax=Paenibacillus sp. J2TS4 TaxID=2807194 RepID=UPI001B19F17F|nr:YugN family protein [Paenibacillus sp. J2TS4]GIP34314.1 hypothetical protein J2TS4_35240 [Paenibacillus sp. J2TS4]
MIPISSSLENREEAFVNLYRSLQEIDFTLGGNWEYGQGSFDRALDEKQQMWLRIPFQVTHGTFDGDHDSSDAIIQLGQPFALRHLYRESSDPQADMQIMGGLINQFQTPVDKDAEIGQEWADKAREIVQEVEQHLS